MWPPLPSNLFVLFHFSTSLSTVYMYINIYNIKNHLPRICGERLAMLGAKHNVFGGTFVVSTYNHNYINNARHLGP